MTRFTVRHHKAIWETTTFEVEVPDPLPDDYDDPVVYIRDNVGDLLEAALDADTATVNSGDSVPSVDDGVVILDQAGKVVYKDADDGGDY